MSSDVTILGFGASTMQGVGDVEGGFFARLVKLLPGRRLVNLGVSGDTTRDMLRRLELVEAHQPFRAVVLLGCNDLPRDRDVKPGSRTSVEEYAANLDPIFAALTGEGALFVSSFPPDPLRTGVAAETMDAYMAEAVRLAKRHGLAVWDLYAEIRQSPKLADYWAADGLHFNPAGHAWLAERIAKLLA